MSGILSFTNYLINNKKEDISITNNISLWDIIKLDKYDLPLVSKKSDIVSYMIILYKNVFNNHKFKYLEEQIIDLYNKNTFELHLYNNYYNKQDLCHSMLIPYNSKLIDVKKMSSYEIFDESVFTKTSHERFFFRNYFKSFMKNKHGVYFIIFDNFLTSFNDDQIILDFNPYTKTYKTNEDNSMKVAMYELRKKTKSFNVINEIATKIMGSTVKGNFIIVFPFSDKEKMIDEVIKLTG